MSIPPDIKSGTRVIYEGQNVTAVQLSDIGKPPWPSFSNSEIQAPDWDIYLLHYSHPEYYHPYYWVGLNSYIDLADCGVRPDGNPFQLGDVVYIHKDATGQNSDGEFPCLLKGLVSMITGGPDGVGDFFFAKDERAGYYRACHSRFLTLVSPRYHYMANLPNPTSTPTETAPSPIISIPKGFHQIEIFGRKILIEE